MRVSEKRLVARPYTGKAVVDVRETERHGAGRQDEGVGGQIVLFAVRPLDAHGLGADQTSLATADADLQPLRGRLDLGAQLGDDAVLALTQTVEVDRGGSDAHAELLAAGGVREHARRAQEGLGRDASPVEASPTEVFSLDEYDVRAETCGFESGVIAAGTAAEDDDAHGCSLVPLRRVAEHSNTEARPLASQAPGTKGTRQSGPHTCEIGPRSDQFKGTSVAVRVMTPAF